MDGKNINGTNLEIIDQYRNSLTSSRFSMKGMSRINLILGENYNNGQKGSLYHNIIMLKAS